MYPAISATTFDWFFAWAPLVLGVVIYAIFVVAKRATKRRPERAPIGQSFACASVGGAAIASIWSPREHDGAVSWYCSRCAAEAAKTRANFF